MAQGLPQGPHPPQSFLVADKFGRRGGAVSFTPAAYEEEAENGEEPDDSYSH